MPEPHAFVFVRLAKRNGTGETRQFISKAARLSSRAAFGWSHPQPRTLKHRLRGAASARLLPSGDDLPPEGLYEQPQREIMVERTGAARNTHRTGHDAETEQ